MSMMKKKELKKFQKTIWDYYKANRRDFAWRRTKNPYRILVSEIMLQQTQTSRVVGKYKEFLKKFPNFKALAEASTADVLKTWQGLGYNRRALMLKKLAQEVVQNYNAKLPANADELIALPGIGKGTAGAIMAFAFNAPVVFIETNIRRVYIHFFFSDRIGVSDAELLPLIENTLPQANSREWYHALMDYGAMLGQTRRKQNPNRRSAHYTKQSKFEGSDRQIRGALLRVLLHEPQLTVGQLVAKLGYEKKRIVVALKALKQEGFIF